MPSYLLRYHGTDVKLPEDRAVIIGRQPDCDIVVNDPGASRRHVSLKVEPEGVWLEDLGSQNGTFINGQRVQAPVCLKTGDWFRIGRDEFAVRVVWERTRGAITAEEPVTLPPQPTTTSTQRVRAMEAEEFGRDKTQAAPGGLRPLPPAAPAPPAAAPAPPRRPSAQTLVMDGAGMDPVLAVVRSCMNAIGDTGLPVLDRVTGALHLLQALVDMRAEREACELLGQTLDLLRLSSTAGLLPPLVAARAHALLGRWWMQVGAEPEWVERAEALRRAERL